MLNWGNERILVVAPHPDDEVIGCGGLISVAKAAGARVYVQFVTVGSTDDYSQTGRSTLKERMEEVVKVAQYLRFDDYDFALAGNEFHLKLDATPQANLIDLLERRSKLSVAAVTPTLVLVPAIWGYNQDHRATALAMHTALRPGPPELRHQPAAVWFYEQLADQWAIGDPHGMNVFLPLHESHVQRKLEAMSLYRSQVRLAPDCRSLRSLEALARVRGAQVGADFAEAFRVARWRLAGGLTT